MLCILTATPFCPLFAFDFSLTRRMTPRSQHALENDFEALEIDMSEIGIVPSLRHGAVFVLPHLNIVAFVRS